MKIYTSIIFAVGLFFVMDNCKVYANDYIELAEGVGREEHVSKNQSVPPLVETSGQLLNGYKAKLKVLNQVYMIDLKASKKVLEQMDLYKNGRLQKEEQLIVSDYIQLKPIITTAGKGIRGVQRVQGVIPNKSLGEIVSVWYYRKGKWMLQDIEYTSNYKKMYHYIEMGD